MGQHAHVQVNTSWKLVVHLVALQAAVNAADTTQNPLHIPALTRAPPRGPGQPLHVPVSQGAQSVPHEGEECGHLGSTPAA